MVVVVVIGKEAEIETVIDTAKGTETENMAADMAVAGTETEKETVIGKEIDTTVIDGIIITTEGDHAAVVAIEAAVEGSTVHVVWMTNRNIWGLHRTFFPFLNGHVNYTSGIFHQKDTKTGRPNRQKNLVCSQYLSS